MQIAILLTAAALTTSPVYAEESKTSDHDKQSTSEMMHSPHEMPGMSHPDHEKDKHDKNQNSEKTHHEEDESDKKNH